MVINSVKCRLPFPQPEMRNKKMCDACTTRNETKQSKEMRKNTKKALEECKKGNKGRRGLLSGYTFLQIKHRNMQTNLPSYNSEQKKNNRSVCQAVRQEETFAQHAEGRVALLYCLDRLSFGPLYSENKNQENTEFSSVEAEDVLLSFCTFIVAFSLEAKSSLSRTKRHTSKVARRFALLFCLWRTTYKI